MSNPSKSAALPRLGNLPRAPASDLKKQGWRATMNTVRSKGRLLITNHDEPEAVIMPAAEYDALMQIVERSESRTKSVLQDLRQDFDKRLAILQDRSVATRLRASITGRVKLGGKVKAGATY